MSAGTHRRLRPALEIAEAIDVLTAAACDRSGLATSLHKLQPAPDTWSAQGHYAFRRKRDTVFQDCEGLFGEPAWDILLDLHVREAIRATTVISSAMIAAAVPPTTALRHIGRLEKLGLVRRRPDPSDARRSFLSLTNDGADRMHDVFLNTVPDA